MENKSVSKRKKEKHSDTEDDRREKKMTKRRRSRSRSNGDREKDTRRKRRHSRSRSPNGPVKQEKRREDALNDASTKKDVPERKPKETDMLNTRTGGAYIPPARLRMMQAQITDKSSVAYQRLAWEALKKSIHGYINKINVGNIGIIIKELLKENIVRGRGLLCRSVIQAQAASPTFTNVYAALVSAVNSRFPNIGELLLKRLVIQFKRGFKRNDKPTCISSASFIAHLVNQRVAHEILALELLTLLVESPTDDSVEVAIAFLKECGQKLTEVSSKGVNAIFEMLRNILHEGHLDKRVQYMIEVMFQVWKDGFKDHPALIEELELVPEEEQFTHLLMLDDATDPQDILNVFKFDDKYEENEQKYKTLSKEILGSDAESGEEDGSEESGSGESEDEEEQEGEQKGITIIDNTETNLVALRRTIYLTINSSLDFEECAHKLMKMQLKPGQEVELCHMFLDCCAEQRTYEKFYGLLAQRFCNINRIYIGPFEEIFKDSYSTAHRLDTNRLRNVSKFFAHLLFTDSISWEVMECVKLNEEDTTSSSRIYIKILFQELAEYMGLKKLNDRLKDATLQSAFSGIFPRDNPKNTRFSINFFTSIGLGGLTDELREHLKQMPKNIPAPVTDINLESESSSSSSSSDSSSDSSSSSDSEEENEKKKKSSKTSTEKSKSKDNADTLQGDATNKDKNDKDQRWGHDGFYETYGENARRHDNRPDRSEHNNFNRSRDTRHENREGQGDGERMYRDNRNNRDMNEKRNRRDVRNSDEMGRHRVDNDNNRQERERPYEKRRDNIDNNERKTKYDGRHEKPLRDHSNRIDKRRDEDTGSRRDGCADDRTQDRSQRRDRDRGDSERDKNDKSSGRNDRARADDRNGGDSRLRDYNSEREKKDKGYDRNNRVRNSDHNEDDNRFRERDSEKKKIDKSYDRNDRFHMDGQNKNNDNRTSEREKRDKEKNHREREDYRNDKGDRIYHGNSEREQINKERGKDRVRNSDRSRDKKTEDKSSRQPTEKDLRRDEDKNRVVEHRDRNDTNNKNKDKLNVSSEEEDSRHRQKEGSSKSSKKENKNRPKETEESKRREEKGSTNNKSSSSSDRKKSQKTSKGHKRRGGNKSSSESSSSSSSSSENSSSDSETEHTGGRYWDSFDIEKPFHKDSSARTPEMTEKRHKRRER